MLSEPVHEPVPVPETTPRWGSGPVVARAADELDAQAEAAAERPKPRWAALGDPQPRWGAGPVGAPKPAWGARPPRDPDPVRDAGDVRDAAGPAVPVADAGRVADAGPVIDLGPDVGTTPDRRTEAERDAVPVTEPEPVDAAPATGPVPPPVDGPVAIPGPVLHEEPVAGPTPATDTAAQGATLLPAPHAGPHEAVPTAGTWTETKAGTGVKPGTGAATDTETGAASRALGSRLPSAAPAPPRTPDRAPEDEGALAADADTALLPEFAATPSGDAVRPREEARAAVTMAVGAADPVAWWGAGRRQPVISTETTAPIPVHLLFRDDDHGAGPDATGGTRRTAVRRPPMPRSPQTRASGRPAPLADARLAERPGPALPGWAALLTAAAGAVAGLAVLWWHGALPAAVPDLLGIGARPYAGMGTGSWALIALLVTVALFALGGLGRGRVGYASVLTLFGDYRGTVRRTGLLWVSPLLLRRRVDVRLRHWRSEPLPAVDASGTALRVVVLVVWRVKDTARAALGIADHERYLRDQVEAALARVLSQLPADAFHEDTRTLRDAEAVGDALTRVLRADCEPVGVEVYSAQPTGIEYAPEVAAAMQRCRVAAIDAKHRDGVLTAVVDAVDDTVGRLTARGIVELDAYEHKALVRDLTVAFYTGRSGGEGA
ncbi:SPFH domain-containing protein [Streptomyces sp. NBC_00178]|nr:SPFH domain-containing protein [Streptomyces sp. NBC_00178]